MTPSPTFALTRPTPALLPTPHAPQPEADSACPREACFALKRRLHRVLQELDALRRERDGLRAVLDAEWVADWTPIGGELAAGAMSDTERRVVEVLLGAGRDVAGEFHTVPHAAILRRVWGVGYADATHLLRVNASRARLKLRCVTATDAAPHGWDIHAHVGYGYRLAPFDPTRPSGRAVLGAEEAGRIRVWHAEGLGITAIARRLHRDHVSVRKVLNEEHGT